MEDIYLYSASLSAGMKPGGQGQNRTNFTLSTREFNMEGWFIVGFWVVVIVGAVVSGNRSGIQERKDADLKNKLAAANGERDRKDALAIAAQQRVDELTAIVANQTRDIKAKDARLDFQSREIAELQGVVDARDAEIARLKIRGDIG